MSVDEVEVLAQNRAFYAAFRQRDLDSMDGLWAQRAKVSCVHPGWQPLRGREQVMASWRAILGQASVPQIRSEDASAHVFGDTAFVLCEELVGEGRLVATNVFVREEGDWRLVHHQAGPMAPEAEEEASDDHSLGPGGALGGLSLNRFLGGKADSDSADGGMLDDDAAAPTFEGVAEEDHDPLALTGGDALAGGGSSAGLGGHGGAGADDREPHGSGELDDNEAPEPFFNLVRPPTRRLLN